MRYVSKSILREVYPTRPKWAHKGQFGKLLVVAGCRRFTGSPIFVGMAACRAGCDLVFIAAPERAADKAARFSPNLITEPLKGCMLDMRNIRQVRDLIADTRPTAMVIGPALWRAPATFRAIRALIKESAIPMVIDADAIRALASAKEGAVRVLKGKTAVLTPHANEFLALAGTRVSANVSERIRAVKACAARLGQAVLLKGHVDIISDGRAVVLNETGSPLMTKGGMGDTLAGICGAYLARGCSPLTAAAAAAFVNGRAGELAVKEKGESALATDLIEKIPAAIKR
ncbi:MAG: NAD(P)H-hydrate dehydratase [Candidatus Aenigmatarchaeota archaeon]